MAKVVIGVSHFQMRGMACVVSRARDEYLTLPRRAPRKDAKLAAAYQQLMALWGAADAQLTALVFATSGTVVPGNPIIGYQGKDHTTRLKVGPEKGKEIVGGGERLSAAMKRLRTARYKNMSEVKGGYLLARVSWDEFIPIWDEFIEALPKGARPTGNETGKP